MRFIESGKYKCIASKLVCQGVILKSEKKDIHIIEMVNHHTLFSIDDYLLFYLIDDIVRQPRNVFDKINTYLKKAYS